jgi:hypothetical protein
MYPAFREQRTAELRLLQSTDPRELIAKYCEVVGEPPGNQLPHRVSFNRMIETIVESEATQETSAVATNPARLERTGG